MAILQDIKTIVIVMLENRSFDNVLGHLRTIEHGDRRDIDGLNEPAYNPQYRNFFEGASYAPAPHDDTGLRHDLPHGRAAVARQMAASGGGFAMNGFVQAYFEHTGGVGEPPPPMAFLTPQDVPVSNFFANNFLVCDRWFAPVPADTQPNRSIAFSGYTMIEHTGAQSIPVPEGSFIFDWLNAHKVDWRVYHSGLSFFMLFKRFAASHGERFHPMRDFAAHFLGDPADAQPSVIFIEPEYTDSPFHPPNVRPNDNQAPTPIGHGEAFLHEIYATLSADPIKFAQTLLIVTCDEHGGFYDHVAPPPIETRPPPGARFDAPFASLGPRVPAMMVSPRIGAGTVFKGTMDHTSILQLLAEKFDPGNDYNEEVRRRRLAGIHSAGAALAQAAAPLRTQIAPMPEMALAARSDALPATRNAGAFIAAGTQLLRRDRSLALKCFPELAHLLAPLAPAADLQSQTMVVAGIVHARLLEDHPAFNGNAAMGADYGYDERTIGLFLADVRARLRVHQPRFDVEFNTEFARASLAQSVVELAGSIDAAITS